LPTLKTLPNVGGIERLPDFPDRVDRHVLDDEVRRLKHQPSDAMILHAAGVERRDRSTIAVTDQQPLPETDRVKQPRQDLLRLDMHEIELAWQLRRAGIAVTHARPRERAAAGRRRDFFREVAPHPGRAEPLMQQDQRRRLVRMRPGHAVFQPQVAEFKKALVGKRRHEGCI